MGLSGSASVEHEGRGMDGFGWITARVAWLRGKAQRDVWIGLFGPQLGMVAFVAKQEVRSMDWSCLGHIWGRLPPW